MSLLESFRRDWKQTHHHEGVYPASSAQQVRALRRAICRLFGMQLAMAFHEAAINVLHTPSKEFNLIVDKFEGITVISSGLEEGGICSIGDMLESGRGSMIICSCSDCTMTIEGNNLVLHMKPLV